MKFVVVAALALVSLLIHLGAIGVLVSKPGLALVVAVLAVLLLAHVLAKHIQSARPLSGVHTATMLAVAGAVLVVAGFVLAHLCNVGVGTQNLCAYPVLADFVFHKIGPVLLLAGLVARIVWYRRGAKQSRTTAPEE